MVQTIEFVVVKMIVFTVFLISGYGLVHCTGPADGQQAHQIKVMSYNIHHANPPSRPEDSIDIDAIVKVIEDNDPDLVALQEVDVNVPRSGLIDESQIIASRLEMYVYFAKAIDYHGGEYGIAILSRFPISEEQTYQLPSKAGTEPRVLATVKVKLSEEATLRFGCTHLDVGRNLANQVSQIKKVVDIATTEQLPFIIAGDFNAKSGSEVISVSKKIM